MIVCDICKQKPGTYRVIGVFAKPATTIEKLPSLSYPHYDICAGCEQELHRLVIGTVHEMMRRIGTTKSPNQVRETS
jgi:hypothetical protein